MSGPAWIALSGGVGSGQSRQGLRATLTGSMPAAFHQGCSSPAQTMRCINNFCNHNSRRRASSKARIANLRRDRARRSYRSSASNCLASCDRIVANFCGPSRRRGHKLHQGCHRHVRRVPSQKGARKEACLSRDRPNQGPIRHHCRRTANWYDPQIDKLESQSPQPGWMPTPVEERDGTPGHS